ncbi:MAG: hypothetical protein ACPGXK_00260 [Phycisphaerae bacterium]
MALITISGGTTIGAGGSVPKSYAHVYLRKKWGDDWRRFNEIIALEAVRRAWPARSEARLQINVGDIKRNDVANFQFRPFAHDFAAGWQDHYVALVAVPEQGTPYTFWCGYIPHQEVGLGGEREVNSQIQWEADIVMTAYGLDYLLERREIEPLGGSWFREITVDQVDRIDWRPDFNRAHPLGNYLQGNRSDFQYSFQPPGGGPPQDAYVFGAYNDSSVWSARDIIEYALVGSQSTISPNDEPHFFLGGPADAQSFLGEMKRTINHEGNSVRSLIEKLVDRRRGLHLWTSFQQTDQDGIMLPDGPVEIVVESLAKDPIAIGDVTLPANPSGVDLAVADALEIEESTVTFDSVTTYDRIVVTGERVVSCFTLGFLGTMGADYKQIIPAWSSAMETTYQELTDQERSNLDEVSAVYRLFRIPSDFDWFQGDALALQTLIPNFDANGNITFDDAQQPAPWNRYVRILPSLPLTKRTDQLAEQQELRFDKPFAIVEVLDEDGAPTGRWEFVDAKHEDGVPSATVTPGDRGGTIEIKFGPAHLLARNHFDPDADPNFQPTETDPAFDYERMLVTIAVEVDTRSKVDVVLGSGSRTLVIHVPDAHVWVTSPFTVDGLGVTRIPHTYVGPRVVRDDTRRLREVAAAARAWYGGDRRAINIREHGIFSPLPLGTMVSTIQMEGEQKEVNTVVTEQKWDLDSREPATSIRTGFTEIDLGGR